MHTKTPLSLAGATVQAHASTGHPLAVSRNEVAGSAKSTHAFCQPKCGQCVLPFFRLIPPRLTLRSRRGPTAFALRPQGAVVYPAPRGRKPNTAVPALTKTLDAAKTSCFDDERSRMTARRCDEKYNASESRRCNKTLTESTG